MNDSNTRQQMAVAATAIVDETGNRHGRLTVIEMVSSEGRGAHFRCVCDCGNEIIAPGNRLRSGSRTSCGCARRLDIRGQRFGSLVALRSIEGGKEGETFWECLCDCGNTHVAIVGSLRCGNAHRCSTCARQSKSGSREQGGDWPNFRVVMSEYMTTARRRGRSWELSYKQARALFEGDCYYCGAAPNLIADVCGEKAFIRNGIDRKDNDEGYTADNCVSCCSPCNFLKGSRSADDFLSLVKRIAEHRGALKGSRP